MMVTPHETRVTVRGSGGGFAQEISARSHRLVADEPLANGGTDTGPTPYDLLLAALGS
jgi:putative redox protein